MRLRVDVPDGDVEFIDAYAKTHGYASRGAVLQRAVRLLRETELSADYTDAWRGWEQAGDPLVWESTSADGLAGS